jgi:Ca-activated chloride channel family protein
MAGFVAVTAIVVAGLSAWCVNMKNPYMLLVVFMLPIFSPAPSHAFEWNNLWQTPDQQGEEFLQQEKPEQAAAMFKDPEWKASALYRAEKYKESAQALDGSESADARYNRGNALAKSGDLKAAAEAYEQALKIDKMHEDASFNLDLVKKAMQKQQQSDDQNKSDKSDKSDKSEQKSDEKKQDDQGDKSEQDSEQQSSESEKGEPENQSGQNKKEDDQSSESQQSEQQQSDEQQEQNEQSQSEQEKQTQADAEKEKERQQQAMQSAETKEQKKAEAEEEKVNTAAEKKETDKELTEEEKAQQQWLRRIPDDPGGLLRRKFRYQYRQRGQQQANKEEQAW